MNGGTSMLSLTALWWYLVFAPCVQCIAMRWLLFTNKWKKILLQTFPLSLLKRMSEHVCKIWTASFEYIDNCEVLFPGNSSWIWSVNGWMFCCNVMLGSPRRFILLLIAGGSVLVAPSLLTNTISILITEPGKNSPNLRNKRLARPSVTAPGRPLEAAPPPRQFLLFSAMFDNH